MPISPDFISTISITIFLLPLLGFIILNFVGKKLSGGGDWVAIAFLAICTALSLYVLHDVWVLGNEHLSRFNWAGNFTMGTFVDRNSSMMLVVITLVSLLVHVFSTVYMKGDNQYTRYFAYLQLFTFSMLGLVLVNNLVGIYIFWELVGLSSYLLIGFWKHKPSANKASKKAFLLNRIGDAGFLIGVGAIFALYNQVDIQLLTEATAPEGNAWLQWLAGFGLLCGAIGKSAQFPLSIWLPDAMEGPTPVSALIHAATMVAAGVYLLARFSFLLIPDVQLIIASVGALTAFMAAFSALTQTDIKKVLAYSTISQLGLMILGIGIGTPNLAMFHLLTHAFFKACLFLSSGSIIHTLHEAGHKAHLHFDAQDMRLMGGLRKKLPITFLAFTLASLSLAGIPFFAGFLSKDAIMIATADFVSSHAGITYFCILMGLMTALCTAFYVGRMLLLVFFGESRNPQIMPYLQEASWAIRFPIALLASLSIWIVYSLNPFTCLNSWALLFPWTGGGYTPLHLFIEVFSIILALGGIILAFLVYKKNLFSGLRKSFSQSWLYRLSFNFWHLNVIYTHAVRFVAIAFSGQLLRFDKKWIDGIVQTIGILNATFAHILAWVDRALIDGTVHLVTGIANRTGNATRSIQGGKVQLYFVWGMLGILAFIYFLLF